MDSRTSSRGPAGGSERVTVVLPFFNRVDVLSEAVRSVLAQTHQALTLILVDDGSTDGSRQLARSFDDPRVQFAQTGGQEGACAARNIGIALADTDLIAFQDSDDVWAEEKLSSQIAALRTLQGAGTDASVIGCGWHYRNAQAPTNFEFGPFTREDVLASQVRGIGTPMLLVDRARAAVVRFDERMPARQDQDFVLSCLSNGTQVAVLPRDLVTVSRGRDDHVANPRNSATAHKIFLEKYSPELASRPNLDSWYAFRTCRDMAILRDAAGMRAYVRSAMVHQGVRRLVHLTLGFVLGEKGLAIAQRFVPLWDPRTAKR